MVSAENKLIGQCDVKEGQNETSEIHMQNG